jgi:hypothetical protein
LTKEFCGIDSEDDHNTEDGDDRNDNEEFDKGKSGVPARAETTEEAETTG